MMGYQEIKLEPGQFIFGRKAASKATCLSEQTIRTCLKALNHEKLTIKTTNKFSIITIMNWDSYQNDDSETNQQTNKRLTNKQPASNQQLTTYKKDKKDKNVKETIIIPDWLDPDVWNEYKKYRQNGKGKFTPYAQRLAINKLTKLKEAGNDPTEVMQRTIECGWSGLYPLKDCRKEETLEEWTKRVSQP